MGTLNSRRFARIEALQSVYATQSKSKSDGIAEIARSIKGMVAEEDDLDELGAPDGELLGELLEGFENQAVNAEAVLKQIVEVNFSSINQIERCVLVLAVLEMMIRPATPRAVIINEWMEISKQFGAPTGYKLINAILDNVPLNLQQDKCPPNVN